MTKFLATYRHHFLGLNGYESASSYITAESLSELRAKMADRHYKVSFDDDWEDWAERDCEINTYQTTSHWRIYHFDEASDINTLPEFQTLMRERRDKINGATTQKEAEEVKAEQERVKSRHALYLQMKEEYEGKDNA